MKRDLYAFLKIFLWLVIFICLSGDSAPIKQDPNGVNSIIDNTINTNGIEEAQTAHAQDGAIILQAAPPASQPDKQKSSTPTLQNPSNK
jgi:hypothetical protein